jgi:hypothetical protein
MTTGPGKYDDITTHVRRVTKANVAMVIILEGNRGSGFSVQSYGETNVRALVNILRSCADQIEEDI